MCEDKFQNSKIPCVGNCVEIDLLIMLFFGTL